jgi:hypothetical protein
VPREPPGLDRHHRPDHQGSGPLLPLRGRTHRTAADHLRQPPILPLPRLLTGVRRRHLPLDQGRAVRGPVHNRKTDHTGKPRPCRCGQTHADDAPELGTPLDPATYDYTGAVLWNAYAGQLWARFTTYLRRALAEHLHMTQKALNAALRVSFDGPDGHTSPPPPWAIGRPDLRRTPKARAPWTAP